MKRIIYRISKIALKAAVFTAAAKMGAVLIKKMNEDGDLEAKINDTIDANAEKLKALAKSGIEKSLKDKPIETVAKEVKNQADDL